MSKVLGGLYSFGNRVKRRLKDLVANPVLYAEQTADEIHRRMRDEPEKVVIDAWNAHPLGALAGVIKQKGGNWLTGSVEDALRGLKSPYVRTYADAVERYGPERAHQYAARPRPGDEALNNWIEGPLTKYVKTRMASPEDEVRKLAEQGILHFDPPTAALGRVSSTRAAAGFPPSGVSGTPLGSRWEDLADVSVHPDTASRIYGGPKARFSERQGDTWFDPETGEIRPREFDYLKDEDVFYSPAHAIEYNLGFDHLIDELSNALNPASGLPRNLQVTPESLKQMSMEKAVRRVDEINKWRAQAMEQAKLKELETSGMLGTLTREYAENNPMGLRWVEYTRPEKLSESVTNVVKRGDEYVALGADGQPIAQRLPDGSTGRVANGKTPEDAYLAGQLITEGNIMGHCVGSYCEDVASGGTRIFSLKDAKGEPHVTIEVAPKRGEVIREDLELGGMIDDESAEADQIYRNLQQLLEQRGYDDAAEIVERVALGHRHPPELQRVINELYEEADAMLPRAEVPPEIPPRIVQIKGKQNRAPNEEYLPFVQDFVRNSPLGSQWSEVGDLANTGLVKLPDNRFVTNEQLDEAIRRMTDKPDSPAINREWFMRQIRQDPKWWENAKGAFEGFAQGGMVQPSWPEPEYNSWDVFAREL